MTTFAETPAYYITTAIPYVNADPHVGFALELLQADVLARYHRQQGLDVRFQTGTDDNSLKNVRAARERGVPVREFVGRNSDEFQALRSWLNLSYDDFIRTSADARHEPGVHKLWRACRDRGDLYRAQYAGQYCVGCEQYYREADLSEGVCPEHGTRPELVKEENYFFRLSRYQDQLLRLIESGELSVEPAHERAAVLRFIKQGLEDFSVSRSSKRAAGWGVPVPDEPDQVTYVWFDALGNYISALDYGGSGKDFGRYWAGDSTRTHVIGKGITRFHAIYWPAILLSAGLALPSRILVHGYLTARGRKIAKSLGNTVSPKDLAQRYGADALRHYLLHHVRSTGDSDFSEDRLVLDHNSELADKLGNLLSRTTALVHKYCGGVIPQPGPVTEAETGLLAAAEAAPSLIRRALDDFRIHEATAADWSLIDEANRYLVQTAPWKLARQSGDATRARLDAVLYNALESVRLAGVHLTPFLPSTSERLLSQLDSVGRTTANWDRTGAGRVVRKAEALFPKIATGAGSADVTNSS